MRERVKIEDIWFAYPVYIPYVESFTSCKDFVPQVYKFKDEVYIIADGHHRFFRKMMEIAGFSSVDEFCFDDFCDNSVDISQVEVEIEVKEVDTYFTWWKEMMDFYRGKSIYSTTVFTFGSFYKEENLDVIRGIIYGTCNKNEFSRIKENVRRFMQKITKIPEVVKEVKERKKITKEEAKFFVEMGFKIYIWEDRHMNIFNPDSFTVIPDERKIETVDFEPFEVVNIFEQTKEIHLV